MFKAGKFWLRLPVRPRPTSTPTLPRLIFLYAASVRPVCTACVHSFDVHGAGSLFYNPWPMPRARALAFCGASADRLADLPIQPAARQQFAAYLAAVEGMAEAAGWPLNSAANGSGGSTHSG